MNSFYALILWIIKLNEEKSLYSKRLSQKLLIILCREWTMVKDKILRQKNENACFDPPKEMKILSHKQFIASNHIFILPNCICIRSILEWHSFQSDDYNEMETLSCRIKVNAKFGYHVKNQFIFFDVKNLIQKIP